MVNLCSIQRIINLNYMALSSAHTSQTNAQATVGALLRQLRVSVTSQTIRQTLWQHPDFPSLLSISDALDKWQVDNAAIQLGNVEQLRELPMPFVVHSTKEGGLYLLIESVANGTITSMEPNRQHRQTEPEAQFAKHWSGVIVKAQKPPKPIVSLYKSADYIVQGKDLFDKAVGMNFLVALQGRVPGINIVQILDEAGFPKLVITMRGGSTTGGFLKGTLPQPLVLVDGVPFDNINQLQSLPASQVEWVEVVNRAESLLGLRGYAGVISIITKNAASLSPTEAPQPDFVRKTIRGY